MTLAEALKNHENDFVYIGSKSGYFYIGTAQNAFDELTEIGNKYLNEMMLLRKKYKAVIKADQKLLHNEELRLKLSNDYIKGFRPFLEREVKEEYKRKMVKPFGTIIIVDGTESGRYWTMTKLLKLKKKRKGKRQMNANEINAKLFKTKAEKIKVYPVRNLRASNLGHPCERYLFLLIKHWDEVKPHDVGLQNIFDLGNTLEEHTIKNIKEAGFEVITPTRRSWRETVKGGVITGREDIRIKDEKGELLPVEIKGLSPIEYAKLNSVNDFLNSKRPYIQGYPAQLFVYMLHFGKDKGFFALTNKLTGETKFIDVPLDYELADKYLNKAERIYEALKADIAPDACEDISVCESCSLAHICGECRRVPTDIELDDELDELINRKQELAAAKKEYETVDKQIKEKVGEREKVITGLYLIERKSFVKKAFTVPESTQFRLNIKRL